MPELILPEVSDPSVWGGWNDAFYDREKKYVIGVVSSRFVAPYLMSAYNLTFVFDPVLAVRALVSSVLVGLAASVYPAVRAGRLDPVEALKTL